MPTGLIADRKRIGWNADGNPWHQRPAGATSQQRQQHQQQGGPLSMRGRSAGHRAIANTISENVAKPTRRTAEHQHEFVVGPEEIAELTARPAPPPASDVSSIPRRAEGRGHPQVTPSNGIGSSPILVARTTGTPIANFELAQSTGRRLFRQQASAPPPPAAPARSASFSIARISAGSSRRVPRRRRSCASARRDA